MKWRTIEAVTALALLFSACGSGGPGSEGFPSPRPEGGVVAGVYLQRIGDGTPEPMDGVRVGIYLKAILPGPVAYNPPRPIAVATTHEGGRFQFTGLDPRRYFVALVDGPAFAPGQWVRVTRQRGASVQLEGCTQCPAPQ
jgi:hypothetical protein